LANLSIGTYICTIADANQCSIIDTAIIAGSNSMASHINFDPTTHQASLSIEGGTYPYTFLWSTNQTDSVITLSQSGNYSVTVTDNFGCTTVAQSDIMVEFVIPTLFSPNADNKNDRFEIKGIESYSQVTIEIYNRWGNLLFTFDGSGLEYKTTSNQWDGKYKGKELPMGAYLFIIDLHNGKDAITGTVSILR
jgi:gliding motility-associated-like protein